jgi:hypothetical protein
VGIERLQFEISQGEKLETLSQIKQAGCGDQVCNPSQQEAEIGGSQSKVSPGKSAMSYLKNKIK